MNPFVKHTTALAVAALSCGPAAAIVTDSGAAPALPAGLSLGGVGLLSNGCSSVLLAGGQYVLASGHCAGAAGSTVSFLGGSVSATIAATVVAPGFTGTPLNDLSISRLVSPLTSVAGYMIGPTPSLPTAVVLAGYGASGSGISGASGPGGTLRFGFNDYDQLAADDPTANPPAVYNGTLVAFDFDDGSAAFNRFGALGKPGEAMLANGDSGGPSFALISGVWKIVGIHSAIEDQYGFGYGAIGYDVLVGEYAGWIAQATPVPEPGTAALFVAGLFGLGALAARRRGG